MIRARVLPARTPPDALRGSVRVFSTALRAHYQPGWSYPGHVRLAFASKPKLDAAANESEFQTMVAGWRRFAATVDEWHGPGSHLTILRPPNVRLVAEWWESGLP